MAGTFDPYHRWLGIPPDQQPPNHYRLLGLQVFEQDPDVIQAAADRQMGHLRTYQTGPHAVLSQKLLNEVAAARVCLLDPARRAAYDAQLRQEIAGQQAPAPNAEGQAPAEPEGASWITEADLAARPSVPRSRGQIGGLIGAAAAGCLLTVGLLIWAIMHGGPQPDKLAQEPGHAKPAAGPTQRKMEPPAPPGSKISAPGSAKTGPPSSPDPARPPSPRTKPAEEPAAKEKQDPAGPVPPQEPSKEKPSETPKPADPGPRDTAPSEEDVANETRLPVPAQADRDKARKLVEEVYKSQLSAAKTAAERKSLAKKLLDQARQTTGEEPARFVLFTMARDISVEIPDGLGAFDAVDELAAAFQVDPLEMKTDVLTRFTKMARLPPQHQMVAEQAVALAEDSLAAEQYALAERLGEMAVAAARKAQNAAIVKQAVAVARSAKEMGVAHAEEEKAQAVLKDQPDHPAANLTVGRYYAIVRGDWETALPYLAAGSDAGVKALAEQDLKPPPATPEDQVNLGDAWWDLGQGRQWPEKEALLLRAGAWYGQAQSGLPDGLARARIDKRLEEIAAIRAPRSAASGGTMPPAVAPTLIGRWSPQTVSGTPQTLEWNVTRLMNRPGTHMVRFQFEGGVSRLDISELTLARGSETLARDSHAGTVGIKTSANIYRLALRSVPGEGKLALRANVQSDGRTDSSGAVWLDPPQAQLPRGQWVDLLRWVELPAVQAAAPPNPKVRRPVRRNARPGADVVQGQWEWQKDILHALPGGGGKIVMLPVRVGEAYDLRVEFSRMSNGNIAVVLPVGESRCNASFAPDYQGLLWVDGREPKDNLAVCLRHQLTAGRRYVVELHVRTEGDSAAIDAVLNGSPCLNWKGKQSSLTGWNAPDSKRPLLGGWDAEIAFHRAQFRHLSGTAAWAVQRVKAE